MSIPVHPSQSLVCLLLFTMLLLLFFLQMLSSNPVPCSKYIHVIQWFSILINMIYNLVIFTQNVSQIIFALVLGPTHLCHHTC